MRYREAGAVGAQAQSTSIGRQPATSDFNRDLKSPCLTCQARPALFCRETSRDVLFTAKVVTFTTSFISTNHRYYYSGSFTAPGVEYSIVNKAHTIKNKKNYSLSDVMFQHGDNMHVMEIVEHVPRQCVNICLQSSAIPLRNAIGMHRMNTTAMPELISKKCIQYIIKIAAEATITCLI